jgi:hypothetical protein
LNTPQQFFTDRYNGVMGGDGSATSRFAPVCVTLFIFLPNSCEGSLHAAATFLVYNPATKLIRSNLLTFYWHTQFTDEFLRTFMLQREMTSNLPVMPGGLNPRLPVARLVEALGSRRNTLNFMILWQGLNGLKSQVFASILI